MWSNVNSKLVRWVQLVNTPLFYLINKLVVVSYKRELLATDIKHKSYVLVSNHHGMLDPFIICYGLGFSINRRLAPYRFFIANRYLRVVFLGLFLRLMGAFPAKRHPSLISGIDAALHYHGHGGTIVIFPEGRISRVDRKHRPQRGIEHLINNNPRFEIVPVRVRYGARLVPFRAYKISVGKPFSGKNMTAEQIMDVVYSLKFR